MVVGLEEEEEEEEDSRMRKTRRSEKHVMELASVRSLAGAGPLLLPEPLRNHTFDGYQTETDQIFHRNPWRKRKPTF